MRLLRVLLFVTLGVLAIPLALWLGNAIGKAVMDDIEAPGRQARKEADEWLAIQAEQIDAQAARDKADSDEKFQLIHQVIEEHRKAYFESVMQPEEQQPAPQ